LRTAAFVLAAAAWLSGCATVPAMTARDDVRRFLVAIRNNDQATFDATVDQQALIGSIAASQCLRTGARGEPFFSCVETTVARMDAVPLSAFRGIAASFGYERGRLPAGFVGVTARRDAYDQVCVTNKPLGACVLWFRGEGDSWRLTSVIDFTRLERL
jgi:hypothetical protein